MTLKLRIVQSRVLKLASLGEVLMNAHILKFVCYTTEYEVYIEVYILRNYA